MQSNSLRPLRWIKIPCDGIGNHRLKFTETVALRRDAAAPRSVVPPCDKTTRFHAGFNGKRYFTHDGLMCIPLTFVASLPLGSPIRRAGRNASGALTLLTIISSRPIRLSH